jgi:hypothetical protein
MTFPSIIFAPSRALPHPRIVHRVAQSDPQTAKFCRRDAKATARNRAMVPAGAYSDISLRGADGLYPNASLGAPQRFRPASAD